MPCHSFLYLDNLAAEVCVHPLAEELASVEGAYAIREGNVKFVHQDGPMEVLLRGEEAPGDCHSLAMMVHQTILENGSHCMDVCEYIQVSLS